MKLTDKEIIKLAWKCHSRKGGGFQAMSPEAYGFEDIQWGEAWRLFRGRREFQMTAFTTMEDLPVRIAEGKQLEKELCQLLEKDMRCVTDEARPETT